MVHDYSKHYNISSTGLCYFNVYGGRLDMAYFGVTDKFITGKIIQIFNLGNCKCNFKYVDDIIEGVVGVMQGPAEKITGEDGFSLPPYVVYNIGNNQLERLLKIWDSCREKAELLCM